MPRTPGEKEKVEKSIRIEKTVIPIVCVIAVAAFILISALLGKNRVKDTSAPQTTETPTPTVSPCREALSGVAGRYGAEVTEKEKTASFSFKSPLDNEDTAVTAYLSSGEVCIRIVRGVDPEDHIVRSKPDTTQSIFVVDQTEEAEENVLCDCVELAWELEDILSAVQPETGDSGLAAQLENRIASLLLGEAKKASVIIDDRLIEIEFSASDKILRLKSEPI